jgi:surface protein
MKTNFFIFLSLVMIVLSLSVSAELCNENVTPCGGGCNETDMRFQFQYVTDFDNTIGDITGWNTSCITNMNQMFAGSDFNQDISGWDVSGVTDMGGVFFQDAVFNQPIGSWDVSSVTTMSSLFSSDSDFNQDISGWNLTSLLDAGAIFENAVSFNQPIGSWDMSSVTSLNNMFAGATSFDQDISSWDVSNVYNMEGMFSGVNLSTSNYDALLGQWSTLEFVPENITFDGGNSQYSSAGKVGRDILTDTYNWTISDGGFVVTYPTEPFWGVPGGIHDWGMMAGLESEATSWNKSDFIQTNITYECQYDGIIGCGLFEPPSNVTYGIEWTNDSGANWHNVTTDFGGCPFCPGWSGGAWPVETFFIDPGLYPDGILNLRIRAFDGFNYSEWVGSPNITNCKALWNCTEINSTCYYDDHYLCLNATDISGCEYGTIEGEENLWFQEIIINRGDCDFCTPIWNCSSFGDCILNVSSCLGVNDTVMCGESFAGNLSDYDEPCITPPENETGNMTNYTSGDLVSITGDFLLEIPIKAKPMIPLFIFGVAILGLGGVAIAIKKGIIGV